MRIETRTVYVSFVVWPLEYFLKTDHNFNGKAKELFNLYCQHFQVAPQDFKGIELEDLYTLGKISLKHNFLP